MSKFETLRDKDGLLNCQKCSRKFLTKTVLEKHAAYAHKNENAIQVDQLKQPPTKIDESESPKVTPSEKECSLCNLSFSSETELEVHISELHSNEFRKEEATEEVNPFSHQCKECKKAISNQNKSTLTLFTRS